MTLRTPRYAAALLAALSLACQPEIPFTAAPAAVTIIQFDPTKGQLPLPNDLLLVTKPASALGLPPAETELIQHFQDTGGFPSDQEVAITINFTTVSTNPATAPTAPTLDLTTFTPQTFFVTYRGAAQSGRADLAPLAASDYTVSGGVGTLTIHNKGRKPWAPGHYAVFVRGGANGVKTASGAPVYPSQIFYLIEQGKDLSTPENVGLLAAQVGSYAAATAAAQQLNGIYTLLTQTGAIADCDAVFPHTELAVAATFAIAPLATRVDLDPGRGLVPLPIDLLRFPGPKGKLTPLAACTLAAGTLDATGKCSSAAAAGFAALDGFSTTAAILAGTSGLIRASTVTPATVQLYDLTDPAHPALVPPSTYLHEPVEFTQSGLSTTIVLQPAGASAGDQTSVFRTRPLKDATDYAVVISDGVLDQSGAKLQAGTVASVLKFQNPLVDAKGVSQLTGIDNATAGGLEAMRKQLIPVISASGYGAAHIAMAYTFRTQTILTTAVQLAALPYQLGPTKFNAGAPTVLTPAAALTKHGYDPATPHDNIDEVLEAQFTTLNLLDPNSGAFLADPTLASAEVVSALISIPKVPARTAQGLTPLVIFRHGLTRGRVDMLALADAFAQKGIIVAAIDAAKHGDRAWCSVGNNAACNPGGTCVAIPGGAHQGDAAPPGLCSTGLLHKSVSASCASPGSCGGFDPTKGGLAYAAGNYLITPNFFRTRDTFRQDLIDQSQLIHVLAPAPANPPVALGNPVFDHLLGKGIVIDPTLGHVGYIGQSLGSLQGAANVAANPRIGSAVFNVGGGTIVDVFTNSPSFTAAVDTILHGLGIARDTAGYIQFLVVAKTILDPADPVNFAGHLKANTLPNLLTVPATAQSPKKVLAQASLCDQTVSNPWNYLFASNLGTGPLPPAPGFGTGTGDFQLFITGSSLAAAAAITASCADVTSNWVTHGVLLDFANPTLTGIAQASAAQFLLDGTQPQSLIIRP